MSSKKVTSLSNQNREFTVQFALRAIVEITLTAKDFTSAIDDAKVLAGANGFVREDVTYQDGNWEVVGVSLLGGWDILED